MTLASDDRDLAQMLLPNSRTSTFWKQAFAIQGSITPHVLPNVFIVGSISWLIVLIAKYVESNFHVKPGLPLECFEFSGAALGLLLVLRTNSGYERWWEARKLWGGIVNQCRNLAISANAYGPADPAWQLKLARWVAAFPHVARASLRQESLPAEVAKLIGEKNAAELAHAEHMPSAVALHIARHLKSAVDSKKLDHFCFLQIDKERALLIDHIGACERIMKTPLAMAYSIKIRRFLAVFLLTLPLALVHTLENDLLVPLVSMLVAYPLFSLDQIGVELQNPFDTRNLSHLPLDEISRNIERNVGALAGTVDLSEALPESVEPVIEPISNKRFVSVLSDNFRFLGGAKRN
jgi:putative membrane protein